MLGPVPPGRQPDGPPRRKTVPRPTVIEPALPAGGNVANPELPANRGRTFHPRALLATIAEGRKVLRFAKRQKIFAEEDEADAVFYIQTGKVTLTAVSKTGQEAMIAMLGEGEFFGEG